MKTPRRIVLVLAAALLFLALPAAAAEYIMEMPVPKDLSIGSIGSIMRNVSAAIEKKTGIKLTVRDHEYTHLTEPVDEMLDLMKKGSVDFAMVFANEYLRYHIKEGSNALPLFTIEMFGKPYRNMCAFTRAGEMPADAAGFKGKAWGGAATRNARYILYQNKVNPKDLGAFFGKMVFLKESDIATMFDAVLSGKVDLVTMPDYQAQMTINANPKYKKIAKGFCEKYEHNWLFVYRKGVSEEDAKKLKKSFLAAHKDPDFAQFKFLLTAVQGKFVDIDAESLKRTKKIAELGIENKWYEEERKFIKTHYKE
jgi:ABC-type phosphate/phosphonate transport system substrate-binding protein